MRSTVGDGRWTVAKEFTGAFEPATGLLPGQRWTVRFGDEMIGTFTDRSAARDRADSHAVETFPHLIEMAETLAYATDRVRIRADCGHWTMPDLTLGPDWRNLADTPGLGASGGTGYATESDGHTMCYACAGGIEIERMRTVDKVTAYLSPDSGKVTTWTGDTLARVTACHTSASAHKVYIQATDAFGGEWYGVGPAETGTYVNLRRRKVQS